ncbi:unnamed protein product [Rhodiola kirilowii]
MAGEGQAVFSALDNAKTQLYHFKAIVIAGMGFFTDAYDLFCITAVTKLLGRLHYYDPAKPGPGTLPDNVNNAITGVALFGTLVGQLFFGWLGDKLGCKTVYGITLVTMVGCAVASGLSVTSVFCYFDWIFKSKEIGSAIASMSVALFHFYCNTSEGYGVSV